MASDVSQSFWERSIEDFNDGTGIQVKHNSKPLGHGSISFGRFTTETLEWEKWSVFTQNRFKEELQKCSALGSVTKKKAYFEEYYKKLAEQKALKEEAEREHKALKEEAKQIEHSLNKEEEAKITTKEEQKQPQKVWEEQEDSEQEREDTEQQYSYDHNGNTCIQNVSSVRNSYGQDNISCQNSETNQCTNEGALQHFAQTTEGTDSKGNFSQSTVTYSEGDGLQVPDLEQHTIKDNPMHLNGNVAEGSLSEKIDSYKEDTGCQEHKDENTITSLLSEPNIADISRPNEEPKMIVRESMQTAEVEKVFVNEDRLMNEPQTKACITKDNTATGPTKQNVASTKSSKLAKQKPSPVRSNKSHPSLRMSVYASSMEKDLVKGNKSSSLLRMSVNSSSRQEGLAKNNRSSSLVRVSVQTSRTPEGGLVKNNRLGSSLRASMNTPPQVPSSQKTSKAAILGKTTPLPLKIADNSVPPTRKTVSEDKSVVKKSINGLNRVSAQAPLPARCTVPKPFSLATDKRATNTENRSEKGLTKVPKFQSKDQRSDTKEITSREESKKRRQWSLETENKSSSKHTTRRSTTFVGSKPVTPTQEKDQGSSALTDILNTTDSTVRKKATSTANATAFSSGGSDRAEKRSQVNMKTQDKSSAKEVEKNLLQVKSKEDKEADLKKVRKNVTFRATPMPDFYNEPSLKNQIRKTTPTQARSPTLGRRDNDRQKGLSKSLSHLSFPLAAQKKSGGTIEKPCDTSSSKFQKGVSSFSTRAKKSTEPKVSSSSKEAKPKSVECPVRKLPMKAGDNKGVTANSNLKMTPKASKAESVKHCNNDDYVAATSDHPDSSKIETRVTCTELVGTENSSNR